jgi:hypothetical protein
MRFHPAQVLGFDILVYVKHRALPPLNIFCGRLQRPVSDIFKNIVRKKQTAFKGVFLLPKIYYD